MRKDEENKETKKSSRKVIGTMNLILIIVGLFLVLFTMKMISLFETYGMVPDTLINCVFVALAGECGIMGWIKTSKEKNKDRVQRSYFLDRDIDKALRRFALDKEKNLTETINDVLRQALYEYL